MDYEKAYKEALELARDYFKANQKIGESEENDMLSDIFPELKEPDDERIRKALICGMNALKANQKKETFADIPIDDCIDWFEKQGSQKPTWSEEDEHRVKDTIYFLETAKKHYASTVAFDACIDWLKSLKNRVQPQNLTVTDEELSQAKKEAYNDALNKIEYHSGEPTFDDGWSAAIWYLKKRNIQPQPKQEWSEEDDRMYNRIISFIPPHLTAESYTACIDWLKSLRLQNTWKPSDEQMDALVDALSLAKNCGEESSFDLRTLYEQLKKLKGE